MNKSDDYVQCELVSLDTGNQTTAWLNRVKSLHVGSVVSFKGQDERWKILRKGNEQKPKSALHTDWPVGGLP